MSARSIRTPPAPHRRLIPLFAAAGVFLFLLLRPAYIAFLRGRVQAALPGQWERLTTNGSFSLLLPQLTAVRSHDEAIYATCVNRILVQGTPDPYWRVEGKPPRGLHGDLLAFYLLAAVAWVCGGSLTVGWAVAAALLGALWFLLLRGIFRWWSGRDAIAVPLALFAVFFPDFYCWFLDINFSVSLNIERYASALFQHHSRILPYFRRMPAPFLSYFLLGAVFWKTWELACRRDRSFARALCLGLAYGAMAFVHPFEYALGMATLTVFLSVVWTIGWPAQGRRNLAVVFLVSVVLAAGYWVMISQTVDPQTRWEGLEILGLVRSRKFYRITLVHWLVAGFCYFQARREADFERRAAWLFLASAQIAVFLCRNSQVALGFILSSALHYIGMGSFLGCLAFFIWLARALSTKPWWNRNLGVSASLALLVWAFSNEKSAAERTYLMFGLPRDIEAGLQWVRKTAPKNSLILSLSSETNETVPLYTSAKVQVPPFPAVMLAPFSKDEYFHMVARLLKTCRADVDRFLSERWVSQDTLHEIQGRLALEQWYFQRVDALALEPALWFEDYLHGTYSDAVLLEGRRRIKFLEEKVPPLAGPFYIWVNSKDTHLFRSSPDGFGGKLRYENSSVKIYEFSG